MARPTADDILRDLIAQQFQARTIVYRDSNYGTVEVATFNITADQRPDFPGEPMTRFISTTTQDRVACHVTLAEALNAIGIY